MSQRPLPPHAPLSPRQLGLLALAGLIAAALPAHAGEAKAPPGILVVPTSQVGEVRGLFLRKVSQSIRDTLHFSNAARVLKDTDRAGKEEDAKGGPKLTAIGKQIMRADAVRQEATDLAMADKHKLAYKKFRHAIKAYELSFSELVDFNKLADAYARAAVSAWHSHKGVNEVKELFRVGLALQPTLVIDRRRAGAKLLAVFDGLRENNEKARRYSIEVVGEAPGTTVYIDGVKVGPMPAKQGGLLAGLHYVQVWGPGWQRYARSVRLKSGDEVVKAKCKPEPTKKEKVVRVWKMDDLLPCAVEGAFTGKTCRETIQAIAAQTGADYVLFSVLAADRYQRLTVHTFLAEADSGKAVAQKPIPVAQNLSDINARMTEMERQVVAAATDFPKARALNKPPKVFK